MSNTLIFITLFLIFLSPTVLARHYPILPSAPSTALPKIGSKTSDLFTMTPTLNHKRQVFSGGEVKNCMPKGSPRSSAPSRYVNYHTLGSLRCFSGKNKKSTKLP
ncbi:hypothetical protein PHJA_002167600 [Phtheirospermum japonicum]|uniref:Uncharacterized protein n=1 Tax=Phtheirospermum japonicum TaxID=374723 RepID=A0A830CYX7_9LAMI|nr:hypothetical protein PHJA_002167600 [Phtheirospermum japonicum]